MSFLPPPDRELGFSELSQHFAADRVLKVSVACIQIILQVNRTQLGRVGNIDVKTGYRGDKVGIDKDCKEPPKKRT
jgi:hypothetical protein